MEHKKWNFRRESDYLFDPNDQEISMVQFTEDIYPSVDDCCQGGLVEFQEFEQPYMYCSSPRKLSLSKNIQLQFIQEPSSHEVDGSSYTSVCSPSLADYSERTPETSTEFWPEFELQNSMYQMDDIFLNSSVEDDMENPFGSLQMVPDTLYRSSSFENLWTDMLIDPLTQMKDPGKKENAACIKASSYTLSDSILSEDWVKAPAECNRLEDSKERPFTTLVPAQLSVLNENKAAADEDGLKSSEEMMLQELELVMIPLNKTLRICFRDALYRLATNSKEQQTTSQRTTADFTDQSTVRDINRDNSRMGRCSELKTNAIDRTVAKLMFSEPQYGLQEHLFCINTPS